MLAGSGNNFLRLKLHRKTKITCKNAHYSILSGLPNTPTIWRRFKIIFFIFLNLLANYLAGLVGRQHREIIFSGCN